LHNDELHDLYTPPNIVKVLNKGGWGGLDMWHAWGGVRCLQGFSWIAWR
jgi:hypothetical protein